MTVRETIKSFFAPSAWFGHCDHKWTAQIDYAGSRQVKFVCMTCSKHKNIKESYSPDPTIKADVAKGELKLTCSCSHEYQKSLSTEKSENPVGFICPKCHRDYIIEAWDNCIQVNDSFYTWRLNGHER